MTTCWCGAGCSGTSSITDPRVFGERDAVAKQIALDGRSLWFREGETEPYAVITSLAEYDAQHGERPTRRRAGHRDGEPEPDPERKARHDAAMAYVTAYRGSWSLILDIRADRRWGTKYMKLSDRQVDVIMQAKERDEARAAAAAADPHQARARAFLEAIPADELLAQAQSGFTFLVEMAAQAATGRPFSPAQLAAIDRCRARGERKRTAVTEGMYRRDDVIFKVQKAVHGSGQLYAKRLVIREGHGDFEYAAGAISTLRPEDRMTPEEAAEFGHLYGFCCVCGATLTDEKSIARGIGPVCAAKV